MEAGSVPHLGASAPSRGAGPNLLALASIASMGAGAIHATAAGAHSEHRAAVVAFVMLAVAQLGWGAWALNRRGPLVSLLGAAINVTAFGGWVQAKTGGIRFIAGLDSRESVQFSDLAAATLALVAIAGALATLASRGTSASRAHPALTGAAAVTTLALVIPGMVATGNHSHAGGHDHAVVSLPVPYTATLPVDLGGVPGIPEEEVAEAEALVTETLQKLPQFADVSGIVAMGYRTIGDAESGYEHFVNWRLITDGRVLDADYPESLVFQIDPRTGEKILSAAMFIANPGDTLDTVPDVGGALVQWHVHDDLCYAGEPNAWRVADVIEPGEERLCDHAHGAPA
ncbi:MAG TPA: hypothetical protein VFY84_11545 [Jiangellales bacterium]|nr:hypothetical protein [Jiangellales bacterium]